MCYVGNTQTRKQRHMPMQLLPIIRCYTQPGVIKFIGEMKSVTDGLARCANWQTGRSGQRIQRKVLRFSNRRLKSTSGYHPVRYTTEVVKKAAYHGVQIRWVVVKYGVLQKAVRRAVGVSQPQRQRRRANSPPAYLPLVHQNNRASMDFDDIIFVLIFIKTIVYIVLLLICQL